MDSAFEYFKENIAIVEKSLRSVKKSKFDSLLDNCVSTLKQNKKIIVTGLGKNVPVCKKFVSTMISMGLNASFLGVNSALHGDVGIVQQGDLVIVLTKSASTAEIIDLVEIIKNRGVTYWVITNNGDGVVAKDTDNIINIDLEHEGDPWNIIPNNSSTINLIILQTIAIKILEALDLSLEEDFKPNHPGGMIGAILYDRN